MQVRPFPGARLQCVGRATGSRLSNCAASSFQLTEQNALCNIPPLLSAVATKRVHSCQGFAHTPNSQRHLNTPQTQRAAALVGDDGKLPGGAGISVDTETASGRHARKDAQKTKRVARNRNEQPKITAECAFPAAQPYINTSP